MRLVVKHYILHGDSKTLHFSWIPHRDGRRLVVNRVGRRLVVSFFMDPSQRWKEIGSKTLHFSWILHRDGRDPIFIRLVVPHRVGRRLDSSWIAHRDGRRLVVKYHIYHGSLTELDPSQRWKEIGSKTLHFSWIPRRRLVVKHYISSWIAHRDGRRLVVKWITWKEILSWIPHRVGRRLVVKISHGSLTELEGDW